MGVEYAKSNLKTSLSQIWVICQLLPFVSVGQYQSMLFHFYNYSYSATNDTGEAQLISDLLDGYDVRVRPPTTDQGPVMVTVHLSLYSILGVVR